MSRCLDAVNQNGFRNPSALALAMTKFDTGSTGLIEHAKHLEASLAERLHTEKALVTVCVCRNAEHDLECFPGRNPQIRTLLQSGKQRASESIKQPGQVQLLITQIEEGVRTRVFQESFN